VEKEDPLEAIKREFPSGKAIRLTQVGRTATSIRTIPITKEMIF